VEIFEEELTGPTYAQRYIDEAHEVGVETLLDTLVLDLTEDRHLHLTGSQSGFNEIDADAVVLAMGCRERTRPQIKIPGDRPVGVYTAGTAQRWSNVEGYFPGSEIVILGSGDIGMIFARRIVFEGAKVNRVLEVMPYVTGLNRNYVQCLLDFDIPLQLRHTVKRIIGLDRVEAVEAVQVDENWNYIEGTEEIIPCDTLLLSVGLIPENELSRKAGVKLDYVTGGPIVDDGFQTNVPGIFAAGNVVHVYDLVDWVTMAGLTAGRRAARYAMEKERVLGEEEKASKYVPTEGGDNVRYVVPHQVNPQTLTREEVMLQMRVTQPMEYPVRVFVRDGEEVIAKKAMRYARPGEMVTITLKEKHYQDVQDADKLTVSVEPR
jgi:NADPH-dependent 2,4-dienoyl-CoA reductase/sulfur reductase-like enzyme